MPRMCTGLAFRIDDLPPRAADSPAIARRTHDRNGVREARFLLRHARPYLPVRLGAGELHFARWGNRDRPERRLPPTAWAWLSTIDAGGWAHFRPEPVAVPSAWAWEKGVWYPTPRPLLAMLVRPREGRPVAYLVVRPPTRYYEVMTKSEMMPVCFDEWRPGDEAGRQAEPRGERGVP